MYHVGPTGYDDTITHELDRVNLFGIPHELVDATMLHPLGDHRESVSFQIHTDKR